MQRFNFLASPFAHETNSVPGVMEDVAEPPKIARLNKVAIRTKRKIVFVDPAEVFAVEAQGNSVLLRTSSRSYVLRQSISRVAERLSRYRFVRIHRSTIVNKAFVEELRLSTSGEMFLRVSEGDQEYSVSRRYRCALKSVASCWI